MGNQIDEKDVAYSKGMIEEWAKDAPAPVRDAVETVVSAYDSLRNRIGEQEQKHAAEKAKTDAELKILRDAVTSLSKLNKVDDLNDDRDEQRITVGEFVGWNLVGGIRFGRPAVVRSLDGRDFLKITIAPMAEDVEVDFDVFPLAVKRAPDGTLLKFVVDFTKTVSI